jgi:hypothetical protein
MKPGNEKSNKGDVEMVLKIEQVYIDAQRSIDTDLLGRRFFLAEILSSDLCVQYIRV